MVSIVLALLAQVAAGQSGGSTPGGSRPADIALRVRMIDPGFK